MTETPTVVTSSDIIRVSGSTKKPISKQKSLFGIQDHKYCWIEWLLNCSQNSTKETNIAIVSKKVLNSAHNRRKLLVAIGKKNANNPVKQEATNGHEGIIQAYSFESFTDLLNPNWIWSYFFRDNFFWKIKCGNNTKWNVCRQNNSISTIHNIKVKLSKFLISWKKQ